MQLTTNFDPRDHSFCALSYEENERWLQAVWHGYVDPDEARRGAEAYLQQAAKMPSAFLLNDNFELKGPWFESLDWLREVWMPPALTLGLRYVAHIVQADQHFDVLTTRLDRAAPFELQIFQDPTDARAWLREVRWTHPDLT
jgi:hypothetical protein